jgi:hypothetical protein
MLSLFGDTVERVGLRRDGQAPFGRYPRRRLSHVQRARPPVCTFFRERGWRWAELLGRRRSRARRVDESKTLCTGVTLEGRNSDRHGWGLSLCGAGRIGLVICYDMIVRDSIGSTGSTGTTSSSASSYDKAYWSPDRSPGIVAMEPRHVPILQRTDWSGTVEVQFPDFISRKRLLQEG